MEHYFIQLVDALRSLLFVINRANIYKLPRKKGNEQRDEEYCKNAKRARGSVRNKRATFREPLSGDVNGSLKLQSDTLSPTAFFFPFFFFFLFSFG